MTENVVIAPVQNGIARRENLPHLVAGFFMLLKASNNLLYLSVLTTFLDNIGAGSLPWVYLSVNVVFIVFQFQFMSRIVGYEGHWLLSLVNWPAAALSFAAALMFPANTMPVLLAFLVMAMLIDLVSTQAFTAMLNHFFSVAESRRFTPVIYASGSFGFIISGLLLKFVLDFVGIRGLLVGNGAIILVSAIILRLLKPIEEARLAESDEADQPVSTAGGEQSTGESSWQHPLARLLNISSFLILFNKYLVDFLFAAAVAAYFTRGNDLAAFMGVFGASADFAVIGLQTFVMHRVFAAFSIGKILAAMPLVLTVLCFSASFSLKFAVIATVQFLVLLNSKNFTVPATTILMGVIPQKQRVYYRRDMSIVCSISSTLVGIFLLLVRNSVGAEVLFLIAAVVYLALSAVHYLIDQAYLTTLRRAIDNRQLDFGEDQVASLRFLQYGERLQQLQQLLIDENPRIRGRAVEEVSLLPANTATQLLLPMLENENDSRCLTAVARNLLQISPQAAAMHIRRVLAETDDQRLRADIIETIGKVRAPDVGEDFVTPFLDSPHHRVRASAIISTIRLTRQSDMLSRAMHKLAAMAHDAEELMRASAAAVMGELGLPLFVPALVALAGAGETVVAGNAASALARIHTPDAVVALENMLFHENQEVTERVEGLLAASTRESISRISRLLPGITAEERRRLTTRLRSGRHQDSQEVLANILCIDNLEQRRNLIALLEKSDREMVRLMQACIKMGEDDRIQLTVEPLLLLAREYAGSNMPDWAALLGILAGGTLEKPEDNEELFEAACSLIKMLWYERIVIAKAGVIAAAREKWQNRALSLIRMIACFSSEPAPLSRSINELKSGKAYARGMAAEYIDARAGHKLAQMIIPLVDSGAAVPDDFAALVRFAAGLGVEASENDLTAARDRLLRFAVIEENDK
ncbi:MAG: hypothetical protein GQF41_0160 [Candidatus Rifleibacterium amylolyticum]|nr:MAG: hypothetical protein GQF41_0160 [Candidatus Rifleibacterium amylolyticum]